MRGLHVAEEVLYAPPDFEHPVTPEYWSSTAQVCDACDACGIGLVCVGGRMCDACVTLLLENPFRPCCCHLTLFLSAIVVSRRLGRRHGSSSKSFARGWRAWWTPSSAAAKGTWRPSKRQAIWMRGLVLLVVSCWKQEGNVEGFGGGVVHSVDGMASRGLV